MLPGTSIMSDMDTVYSVSPIKHPFARAPHEAHEGGQMLNHSSTTDCRPTFAQSNTGFSFGSGGRNGAFGKVGHHQQHATHHAVVLEVIMNYSHLSHLRRKYSSVNRRGSKEEGIDDDPTVSHPRVPRPGGLTRDGTIRTDGGGGIRHDHLITILPFLLFPIPSGSL